MQGTFSISRARDHAGFLVALLFALFTCWGLPGCQERSERSLDVKTANSTSSAASRSTVGVPRLLDLGAGKCIPCKKMAPILEELKEEYAGALEVVFIDVWQEKGVGEKYGIQSIPTQIFYDPAGMELFRHEGFLAKEDILAKWKELGFTFEKQPSAAPPSG
jgi:thioredoxin 1